MKHYEERPGEADVKPKPWEGDDGSPMSIESLKEKTPSWDVRTWSQYLDTLDRALDEVSIEPDQFERRVELKSIANMWDELLSDKAKTHSDRMRRKLITVLKDLSPRYRRILRAVFWGEKSLATIGEEMGVTSRRISQLKDKAIDELRYAFVEHEQLEADESLTGGVES